VKGFSFGDIVRIADGAGVKRLGLVGKEGVVFGISAPSTSGVDVVGEVTSDLAYNVYFQELGQGWWFAPELVEFVSAAADKDVRFDGVRTKWVKHEGGDWPEPDGAWPSPDKDEK
jgi:hypothetical protein